MLSVPPLVVPTGPHTFASRFAAMLGQHPAVYAPAVLNLAAADRVVDLFDQLPPRGVHGMLRTVAQLYGGEQTLESIDMARRWLYRRAHSATTEVLAEVCERVAPRQLVVVSEFAGTPESTLGLQRLRDAFPDMRFLHLVRHPWHYCQAWLSDPDGLARLYELDACDQTSAQPVPDPQIDWYRRQHALLDFLREVPAQLQYQLRVEDLASETRIVLARVCAWLGLSWNEALFAAMCEPQHSPYAEAGPYGAEAGVDDEFLKHPRRMPELPPPISLDQSLPWRPDRARFAPELVDLARLLGYD